MCFTNIYKLPMNMNRLMLLDEIRDLATNPTSKKLVTASADSTGLLYMFLDLALIAVLGGTQFFQLVNKRISVSEAVLLQSFEMLTI